MREPSIWFQNRLKPCAAMKKKIGCLAAVLVLCLFATTCYCSTYHPTAATTGSNAAWRAAPPFGCTERLWTSTERDTDVRGKDHPVVYGRYAQVG